MRRNLQLALQHIKANVGSVCIMMVELFVVLYLSASFVSSALEVTRIQQLYRQLQLEQVAEVYESDLTSLPDSVKIVNDQNRSGMSNFIYQGENVWLSSVSAQYFSYLQYPMRKGKAPDAENTSIVQGVFTDALKDKFEVGKVYTFDFFSGSADVLMVGQLQGSYVYNHGVRQIDANTKHVFLYDGGDLLPYPVENSRITVFVEDEAALTEEQTELLAWARDSVMGSVRVKKYSQGPNTVIGILVLVLGLATFAGYNFMQMLRKEKIYGVYYLCGASWKDCLQMQLLEDGITLGVPFLFVAGFLWWNDWALSGLGSESMLSWEGFGIMLGVCVLTFLLTSLEGILRLRKKSPVAIIEKWNQT